MWCNRYFLRKKTIIPVETGLNWEARTASEK